MVNYMKVMGKFQNGGSTGDSEKILKFLQDIVTNPEKYAEAAPEFVSALSQTMQANPEGLNDVLTQYPEDVQKCAAIYQGQTPMQKLGGKLDYLHCLKNGGATPGCNCSGNVVKGQQGLPGVNDWVKKLRPGKEYKTMDGTRTVKPVSDLSYGEKSANDGFAMVIDQMPGQKPDTTYRYATGITDGNVMLDNTLEYTPIIEAIKKIFSKPAR